MAFPKRRGTTPAQRAAAKRNIVKAQKRSAELRRRGAGKNGTTAFYGKGRKGRKAAKASTYGRKKDGLSIAQQTRRKQRTNKRKAVASTAVAGGVIAVKAYGLYKSNPDVNKSVKTAAREAKSTARKAKTQYQYKTGVGRQIKKAQKKR